MKKVIQILALFSLFLPVLVSASTVNSPKVAEPSQLMIILLQKITELQNQLLILQGKATSVKIVSSNTEYQEKIAPLADLLDVKISERKLLLIKLEESKCIKPQIFISRTKGRIFNCGETLFHFSTSTTRYVLDNSNSAGSVGRLDRKYNDSEVSKRFGMPVVGVVVTNEQPLGEKNDTYSPAVVIVPPTATEQMLNITNKIEVIDKEITKIGENIQKLKLRYGIPN